MSVRHRSLIPLILLLWCLFYVIVPWMRPMAAPDEYRYAEVPREMILSGDWVVPRLDGMPYFEKPVLGYWMTAVSMMAFGENAFAVRLPSALGVVLMALALIGFFFSPHRQRTPALAAGILLSSLLVVAIGTIALLDALLAGFLSLGMLGFFRALEASSARDEQPWLFLAGIAVGLAFLTKGVVALVIPGLGLLPYLLMTGSLGRFLRRSWIPLLWAVVVAAPWSILVGLRSDFWQQFFWVSNVQRFLNPGENQHGEPLWFYLPRLVAALIPWIALAPISVVGVRRLENPADRRLGLFALCWALMPLIFFTLSSGKLVTYILPSIPGFVIILVLGLQAYLQGGGRRFLGLPALMEVALGLGLPAFLVVGQHYAQQIVELILAEPSRWVPLIVGSLLCALFGFMALVRGSSERRLALMLLAPIFFFTGLQVGLDSHILRSPGHLLEAVKSELSPDLVLVGNGSTVHALCWESRRTDVEVFEPGTELSYGLEHTPGRELLDLDGLKSLVKTAPAGVWLLLNNRAWDRISASFPRKRQLGRDRHFTLVEVLAPTE